MKDNFRIKFNNLFEIAAVMCSLAREDIVLTDKIFSKWTVRKQEGYYTYSEIFHTQFGDGYRCDSLGRAYPTTARTVNFSNLKKILLSKDEALFKQNSWIWDGEFRFLDN